MPGPFSFRNDLRGPCRRETLLVAEHVCVCFLRIRAFSDSDGEISRRKSRRSCLNREVQAGAFCDRIRRERPCSDAAQRPRNVPALTEPLRSRDSFSPWVFDPSLWTKTSPYLLRSRCFQDDWPNTSQGVPRVEFVRLDVLGKGRPQVTLSLSHRGHHASGTHLFALWLWASTLIPW